MKRRKYVAPPSERPAPPLPQSRSCVVRCDSPDFRRFSDLLRGEIEVIGVETAESPVALHIGHPQHWKPIEGKINIGFGWWPASSPDDIRAFYGIDDLIVPSAWNSQTPMPKPHQAVHIVRAGIDDRIFAPSNRTRERRPLRFLAIAERADDRAPGIDLAARAFIAADLNATLDVYGYAPVAALFGDRRVQTKRFIGSERELAALFDRYDALIYSARGDGAGLMALKAMARGLPTLHSGQTGMAEFADLGLLIGSRKVVLADSSYWHEPLVDLLAQRIAAFRADDDKARADSVAVRERHSIRALAARVMEVVHVAQQSRNVPERSRLPG